MYREIIKARLSEQTRKTRRKLGWSQERMSEQLRITTRAYGDLSYRTPMRIEAVRAYRWGI